MNQTNGAENVV